VTSRPAMTVACLALLLAAGWPGLPAQAEPQPGPAPAMPSSPLAEGKKALTEQDYARAVAYFTKAVADGDAATRQEAQELLGLAHERANQLAHAKAEYETYLKAHPTGPDADRVRQRLAGVVAATEAEADAAFAKRKTLDAVAKPPATAGSGTSAAPNGAIAGTKDHRTAEPRWNWSANGSAGQFYYRDDAFSGLPLHGSLANHDVYQNEIASTADLSVHGSDGRNDIRIRLSGYEENGLDSLTDGQRATVSSAYVDMRNRLNGVSARIGRQTRSGGGVFGRFDGALLGWEMNPQAELRMVVGSPVYYGADMPFEDGRWLYGASLDLRLPDKTWDGSLYVIEQDVGSIVDRRAVGAELRHAGRTLFADAGIDFDVYYGEVNAAYASASWTASDSLTIYGSLDYRHVPFLLTSNALLGQDVGSLAELTGLFGESSTEMLAVDRTASATTANLGLTYALSERWAIDLDASIADYTGTPASGGVDAIPDPGTEIYLSAQLSGSGIFTDSDYLGLGLRYLDSSEYRTFIGDFSMRYPVNDKLRLGPRLRVAYRDSKDDDREQVLIMPSLNLGYRLNEHWSLETEAGAKWEDNLGGDASGDRSEFLFALGYRYEF